MIFDVGFWLGKLLYTLGQYEALCDITKDNRAMSFYLENKLKDNITYNRSIGNNITNTKLTELFDESIQASIDNARNHYSCMMIVHLATIIEIMMNDFFISIFIQKPALMHRYINIDSKDRQGLINFNFITQQKNLDSLYFELAKISAKNIANGSFNKVIQRASSLIKTKKDPSKNLISKIEEIFILRNEVVHEAKEPDVDISAIKSNFNIVHELLEFLALTCKENNIPYDDPAFLVNTPSPLENDV